MAKGYEIFIYYSTSSNRIALIVQALNKLKAFPTFSIYTLIKY
jgi:hypothetical protein